MAKLDQLLAIADILGDGEHLECWRHFVLTSRILCCKQLTREKIQLADALLTLGAHAQRGLQYLVCVSVCVSALPEMYTQFMTCP